MIMGISEMGNAVTGRCGTDGNQCRNIYTDGKEKEKKSYLNVTLTDISRHFQGAGS